MSNPLRETLTRFAGLASERDEARGVPPKDWLEAWQLELSYALARNLGQSLVAAVEPEAINAIFENSFCRSASACSAARRATAAAAPVASTSTSSRQLAA